MGHGRSCRRLLFAKLALNWVYLTEVYHLGKSYYAEHKCWDSVLHSLEAAFCKHFFKFEQNFEVSVLITLVVYKVDEACYNLLTLFKLV